MVNTELLLAVAAQAAAGVGRNDVAIGPVRQHSSPFGRRDHAIRRGHSIAKLNRHTGKAHEHKRERARRARQPARNQLKEQAHG